MLLKALPRVLAEFPDALVLHAGPYKGIIGEEEYAARLAPLFEQYAAHYRLLGTLGGAELTSFYRNLDVLCICSLNSTESFGPVSYTHLDVYKRQLEHPQAMRPSWFAPIAACEHRLDWGARSNL